MNKKIVILIQSDPRESHRPAEALRIALGLASCNHAVELILAHTATLLLASDKDDDLIRAEEIKQYLLHLQAWVSPIWIMHESAKRSETAYTISLLDPIAMAKKIASADNFMLF